MNPPRPVQAAVAAAAVAVLAAVGCAPATGGGAAATRPVHVAAAADLKFALDEAVEVFEAEQEVPVTVSYGSSGAFVQQIANGAPVDLYLSADVSYAYELVEAGHAEEDDVFAYAVGGLVVWAPEDSPADPGRGLAGLAEEEVRTVAVANPEHAPYGRAAVAALESAGVHEQVADKLVLGENIAQAAEFVQSGNADAGIVALSLALSPGMRDRGAYTEVPQHYFPRLDQGGAVLADAPEAAHDLAAFLTSPAGQEILASYGFRPPAPAGRD